MKGSEVCVCARVCLCVCAHKCNRARGQRSVEVMGGARPLG